VKKLVKERLGDENHVMSVTPSPRVQQCRTFAVAKLAANVNAPPTIFRSYYAEGGPPSKCAIWQAARAATAAPSFFKPMLIDTPRPAILYIDGGLGHNNPTHLAIAEAERIWSVRNKFCLVSIGTGRQSATSIINESILDTDLEMQQSMFTHVKSSLSWVSSKFPYWNSATNIPPGVLVLLKMANALTALATNTEAVHDTIERSSDQQFPYFRFNVERDVGDIGLEDYKKQHSLATHTAAYLNTIESEKKKIDCVKCLIDSSSFYRKRLHVFH
jgi:predicted acylesterase/phospholipase RssA